MDAYEAYRSPSVKAEPRWPIRDETGERMPPSDNYRRRSPGKISAIVYGSESVPLSVHIGSGIFHTLLAILRKPFLGVMIVRFHYVLSSSLRASAVCLLIYFIILPKVKLGIKPF